VQGAPRWEKMTPKTRKKKQKARQFFIKKLGISLLNIKEAEGKAIFYQKIRNFFAQH
jgi:hypothetical protein